MSLFIQIEIFYEFIYFCLNIIIINIMVIYSI